MLPSRASPMSLASPNETCFIVLEAAVGTTLQPFLDFFVAAWCRGAARVILTR
jgi:hypothetical protein